MQPPFDESNEHRLLRDKFPRHWGVAFERKTTSSTGHGEGDAVAIAFERVRGVAVHLAVSSAASVTPCGEATYLVEAAWQGKDPTAKAALLVAHFCLCDENIAALAASKAVSYMVMVPLAPHNGAELQCPEDEFCDKAALVSPTPTGAHGLPEKLAASEVFDVRLVSSRLAEFARLHAWGSSSSYSSARLAMSV